MAFNVYKPGLGKYTRLYSAVALAMVAGLGCHPGIFGLLVIKQAGCCGFFDCRRRRDEKGKLVEQKRDNSFDHYSHSCCDNAGSTYWSDRPDIFGIFLCYFEVSFIEARGCASGLDIVGI